MGIFATLSADPGFRFLVDRFTIGLGDTYDGVLSL
jgi:hypothetical protein